MPEKVAGFKGTVVCNPPDNLLYDFSAKLLYKGEELPLNGGAGVADMLLMCCQWVANALNGGAGVAIMLLMCC